MSVRAASPLFGRVAFIGLGLIGSSLARVFRRDKLARTVVVCDISARARTTIRRLNLADVVTSSAASAVKNADLVIVCTPMSAFAAVGRAIGKHLKKGAIVTDVGSVKRTVAADLAPHLRDGVHLIPGHPVAGTENSGPQSGFAELFQGRWCILTPPKGANRAAVGKVRAMWRAAGMKIEVMDAEHHDRVLAITSHVPHLIAYTIVNTVDDLESHFKAEVIKFAASGFRDFTRVAASDPVMWRDIFLGNKDAVLEMMGRLYEDIALLQKAIRFDEGATLKQVFTRARRIRRSIVHAKQD